MDYAEPLIKAKQALKDYEQAVLHGKWAIALGCATDVSILSDRLHTFALEAMDKEAGYVHPA